MVIFETSLSPNLMGISETSLSPNPVDKYQERNRRKVLQRQTSQERRALRSAIPDLPVRASTTSHHLPGTECVAETEAGFIFRMPIPLVDADFDFSSLEIPDFLIDATNSENELNRKALTRTLHWNSRGREGYEGIGEPNSAFLIIRGTRLYVDHLLENPGRQRWNSPKQHNEIRSILGYAGNEYTETRTFNEYSGHIAALNITSRNIAYLLLFDAFTGLSAYDKMPTHMQRNMNSLWKARIAPLTTDVHFIKPSHI